MGLDELKGSCQGFSSVPPSFVSDMAQGKCQMSFMPWRIMKQNIQIHEAITEQQSGEYFMSYMESMDK